jgi:hypothetical protein
LTRRICGGEEHCDCRFPGLARTTKTEQKRAGIVGFEMNEPTRTLKVAAAKAHFPEMTITRKKDFADYWRILSTGDEVKTCFCQHHEGVCDKCLANMNAIMILWTAFLYLFVQVIIKEINTLHDLQNVDLSHGVCVRIKQCAQQHGFPALIYC